MEEEYKPGQMELSIQENLGMIRLKDWDNFGMQMGICLKVTLWMKRQKVQEFTNILVETGMKEIGQTIFIMVSENFSQITMNFMKVILIKA